MAALTRVLRRRLANIIALRVAVISVLLGSAAAIGFASPETFPATPLILLIAITYALNFGYLSTLRLALHRPVLVDLQFALDAVLVSACVYLTGGLDSHFSSLYVLPIIAASTVRARRGAMQVAALSATLYVGLVIAQYLNVSVVPAAWWQPGEVELPSALFAQYTVAVNLGGMFAVALLAGSLAERLRSARAGLEDASDEIQDLRAFNAHVLDALPAGVITTDDSYRIVSLNPAAARILARQGTEMRGQDLRDLLQLPPDVRASLPPATEERRRIELTYNTGSARRELGLTISALRFPEGTTGTLVVFQDITEFKRLEREAQLQQRLSAVGDMAAGLAHEVRNPLASMAGSIEILRDELPLTADQKQLMDIVLRESERLNETIRLFLSYASPPRQVHSRFDVRLVLRDTALALGASVDKVDAHVIEAESFGDPVWYDGNETELRQVLWHLGTNGLRAMTRGGRLLLAATLDEPRRELVLSVTDHGCGISPEQLDRVLQPFQSTFRKGRGLGLSIVHRIVTDHGGTIDVASVVDQGTTVTVRLPGATPAADVVTMPPGRTA